MASRDGIAPIHKRFASAIIRGSDAGIAQLVEHDLAKVGVASSSLVSRSSFSAKPRPAGVLSCRSKRRSSRSHNSKQWPGGRVVMQRPAKPRTPVRFRPWPPLRSGCEQPQKPAAGGFFVGFARKVARAKPRATTGNCCLWRWPALRIRPREGSNGRSRGAHRVRRCRPLSFAQGSSCQAQSAYRQRGAGVTSARPMIIANESSSQK